MKLYCCENLRSYKPMTTVHPSFFATLNKTAFLSNTTDPQVLEVVDKQRKVKVENVIMPNKFRVEVESLLTSSQL
jgi:hypothetical protein